MEITWRVISWEAEGLNGGKGARIEMHNWLAQSRQGDVKNSIGNVKPKNLYA